MAFATKFWNCVWSPPGWQWQDQLLVILGQLQAFYQSNHVCYPCHFSSYSRWLCPLIWTWYSIVLSNLPPTSCWLIKDRAFFPYSTKRPPMLSLFTAKRVPNGILLGATWRSWWTILLTSAMCCVVCLPIVFPNTGSACACVRNVGWFRAASLG